MNFQYQICLLGDYEKHKNQIKETLDERFQELGLPINSYSLICGREILEINNQLLTSAMFFGYKGVKENDHPELNEITDNVVPILPIVTDKLDFKNCIPNSLDSINAFEISSTDSSFDSVINVVLENLGLLRTERKLFISYKCNESQSIALQLYEELDRRQFDVFIDVRGIRPSSEFSSVLLNRISDCEVVVVLDSPNFSDSQWTRKEIEQVNAIGVKVLHVLWPNQILPAELAIRLLCKLNEDDFSAPIYTGAKAMLNTKVIEKIANQVESIRSRAVAARYGSLINSFCDYANNYGYKTLILPNFDILVSQNDVELIVVPIVGIPDAERLHSIYEKDSILNKKNMLTLYDNFRLSNKTAEHLNWLNCHLPINTFGTLELSKLIKRIEQ